ncbi:DNA primase family protein [Clostridium butyricum]|uniref:DNA primase family protein n=1 Tax=Clostridium butyricum TaxID=1492 RepID=UPI002ABE1D35|nr:phage/plasmid primase, P4 family [Clostridium butyricum]
MQDYLISQGINITGRHFNCFNHKDVNASAGLTNDGQGFRCFKCNITGDIFKAYSILENKRIDGKYFFDAIKELADRFNISYEVEENINYLMVKDDEYVYKDDNENDLYKVVRYYRKDKNGSIKIKNNGKKDKFFISYSKEFNNWNKGLNCSKRYIYNLKAVTNAIENNETIYFTEGEKCADILTKKLGLTGTTIAFGSNSWKTPYKEKYIEQLQESNLVLLPDNDLNGYSLSDQMANDLKDKVKSLKIIKLNEDIEIPEKGDIEEWLEMGGTKEKLLQLTEKAEDLICNNKKYDWLDIDSKGKAKVIPGVLARYLINNNNFMYCNNNFYMYKCGVYKKCTEIDVQSIIKATVGDELCTMQLIKNVFGLIQIDNTIIKNGDDLNKDLNIINVKNGLYNIEKQQLERHNSNYLSTVQLNVHYSKDAKGDNFNDFLNRMIPVKEQQLLLQELAGYTISGYNNAKKLFIIQGIRDTGKTTFLNVISDIIGKEHISNINLQEITNRFNRAELYGKLANISSDLSDEGLSDTGFIKALVGQDIVQAERKGKDPFTFVNKATLIFPCNHLPKILGDNTDDFLNKIIIIQFNRQLKENEIDPLFAEKLSNEKDYVFLWAMEGLKRLIHNNFKFTETLENKKFIKEYKVISNNVLEFIQNYCEISEGVEIGSTCLYNTYKKFCIDNNYKAVSRSKFKDEIVREYGNKIIITLITSKRISGFKGITLKNVI